MRGDGFSNAPRPATTLQSGSKAAVGGQSASSNNAGRRGAKVRGASASKHSSLGEPITTMVLFIE
jgi:hypothetical protein